LLEVLSAIDPLTPITRCMPAYAGVMEGDFVGAIEPYRSMFEMDSGNPMSLLFLAWVFLINGRMLDAKALVEAFPGEMRETLPAKVAVFLVDAGGGRDDSMAALSLTPEMESAVAATDVFPRMLASGYALRGMNRDALHWLEVAVSRGFINFPFLAHVDPTLSGLRGDPAFDALMARVRERWERFEV